MKRMARYGLLTLPFSKIFHFIRGFIMEVTLLRANIDNAKEIHAMQVEAFREKVLHRKQSGYVKNCMET